MIAPKQRVWPAALSRVAVLPPAVAECTAMDTIPAALEPEPPVMPPTRPDADRPRLGGWGRFALVLLLVFGLAALAIVGLPHRHH